MLNFAVLSAGSVAEKMARTLAEVPGAVRPYAVAARSGERAAALAQRYGFCKSYGSYGELFADEAVDIVYVGTTNDAHARCVRAALEAGKHVLCEKPFTVNRREALPLMALAKEKGLVLMEAMWTRFLPFIAPLQAAVAAGDIGAPRFLEARMGMKMAEKGRLIQPERGGGVLLDLGVYALTLADLLLGAPCAAPTGVCGKNEAGMDLQETIVLSYAGGPAASLTVSISCSMDNSAVLYGTAGKIVVEAPFWFPQKFTVYADGKEPRTVSAPFFSTGFEYEVRAMAQAVEKGLPECPQMPHAATLRILAQMDALRSSWAVTYPFE